MIQASAPAKSLTALHNDERAQLLQEIIGQLDQWVNDTLALGWAGELVFPMSAWTWRIRVLEGRRVAAEAQAKGAGL